MDGDADDGRMPLGVEGLDARIGGGAPRGSVVLLAGEAGAGAREFCYTSAAMLGLEAGNDDLFDLHYGDLAPAATPPSSIHYVSFTSSESEIRSEMRYAMDADIVDAGLEDVSFGDLSAEFFQLSPVPRDWYAGHHERITDLGHAEEQQTVLEAFADYLDEHASDSLLVVDSLTDLSGVRGEDSVAWDDIVYLVKGVQKAARRWGGVILMHVSQDALSRTRLGDLSASVDGTMLFEWETGGNELARTMVVRQFRGVLSQLEAEDIVRFETSIDEAGFDISNVRKIR